jgi:hypothetical protein
MNTKKKGGDKMSTNTREQEIDNFISKEIYACQTALIDEVLKSQLFIVDDIENLYRPFDGKLLSPAICVKCNCEFSFLDSETGQCKDCYEDTEESQEIFEWWLVSPWLGRKLLIEGEPVIDNGYGTWWGRTITGQAISLDDVMQTIYDDILGN